MNDMKYPWLLLLDLWSFRQRLGHVRMHPLEPRVQTLKIEFLRYGLTISTKSLSLQIVLLKLCLALLRAQGLSVDRYRPLPRLVSSNPEPHAHTDQPMVPLVALAIDGPLPSHSAAQHVWHVFASAQQVIDLRRP